MLIAQLQAKFMNSDPISSKVLVLDYFVVKDMFNLQSKTSKDFLKSFSNCYLNILMSYFAFSNVNIWILLMGIVKCNHKLFLQFVYSKINKQTKQNKTVVKVHESL